MKKKKASHTEKELVEGCVRNDRYSQELLYRQHFPAMMRMCMRYTNDREKAMEIVNTGFLRVFKKLHTFSFKGSLEGWIRRLVFHSISDYFKKPSNKVHFMIFEDHDQPFDMHALESLYAEDILKMVEMLPPATKRVFKLFAIDGYSHPQIAKQLNISAGTSKWHLSAARKKLQQMINKNNTKESFGKNQYYAG